MIKIIFFNEKGGVGKTTSVVNIAACLSRYFDKKVLVVDCDHQMNATDYLLTFVKERNGTLEDCLNGEKALRDVILQMYTLDSCEEVEYHDVYVVPSSHDISKVSLQNEFHIKELLEPLEDEYDFCLFDLPPSTMTEVSFGAMVAADYIIVPAKAETDSLTGFDRLIDYVKQIRSSDLNRDLKILGVILNNIIYQRATQKYIYNTTKENMGDLCFNQHIKGASVMEQARFSGYPVCLFNSSSDLTTAYKTLTREILKRIKEIEDKEK